MIDIRQTERYAKYIKLMGWNVDNINHTFIYTRKVPFVGLITKVQRPEEIHIKKIEELAKKERVLQIVIEPKTELDKKHLLETGYKNSNKPFLPTKTLQLDLTKTKERLFKNLKKDAKTSLNKTEDLKIAKSRNLETFRHFWKKSVGMKRHVPPVKQLKSLNKVFGKNVLFIISRNGTAGAVILLEGKMAYYWHAFTSQAGRKELAQYRIVWEAILWAKERGAKIFDFEGIFDKRYPNYNWKGFTHFKKSFGGEEVIYPGVLVKKRLSFKIRR